MNSITSFGYFLLSEWLWSVTWGWYHIPINIVVMCLFFMLVLRTNMIAAVLFTFSSHLFAFLSYTFFVFGILIFLFDMNYSPGQDVIGVASVLEASVSLGLIYALLQVVFFFLVNIRHNLNMPLILGITFASNIASSLIVYFFLPATIV